MKTGLVLEGGAMRGMYTAGVLDTFIKHSINFDGIVGASAGALFGVNYLSKQVGRVIRYNKKFNSDKNYMGIIPLLKEGNIISTEYAYNKVPRELDVFDDAAFKQSGVPFYAVVSNMETGEGEYIKINSVFEQMDTLRASGSMPFVSKPVNIDGKLYLDGAICDSIPFAWMESQGYDKIIVVLTREKGYKKRPMSKLLSDLMYKKYPLFKERVKNRHLMYNASVAELESKESEGKIFVIRPSRDMNISRTEKNPHKLQAGYEIGISDTEKLLDSIKIYLNK